jgi:L-cysteine desulfidase
LEVLEPINDETVRQAKRLINSGKVFVNLLAETKGLFIKTIIKTKTQAAESIIQDLHDNIVSLKLDGREITDSSLKIQAIDGRNKTKLQQIESWLKSLSLSSLIGLLDGLDDDDYTFLEKGVRYNIALAEHGLKYGPGLGIGKTLERLVRQRLIQRDMVVSSRILTAAASDARMAGVPLPAMSSAGSGNHGLTATLPIWAVKDYVTTDTDTVLKSIGLSHVITAYVKAFTGRLSAVCGCSVAAGAGATAGVTYLLGGDLRHIAGAITNLTVDLVGVICDGAKAGCSLKLATAAGTAVQAALFALQGVQVQATDGIAAASAEQTMQNVGVLSNQGMIETDRTILKIMLEKQFSSLSLSEK